MDHALASCVVECRANLIENLHREVDWQRCALGDDGRQRPALDELHRDSRQAAVFEDVEDCDDVRMRQRPGGRGFPVEAVTKLPGLGVGGVDADCLQGHRPADQRIEAAVNHAHRAPAQFAERAVAADGADNRRFSLVG